MGVYGLCQIRVFLVFRLVRVNSIRVCLISNKFEYGLLFKSHQARGGSGWVGSIRVQVIIGLHCFDVKSRMGWVVQVESFHFG